MSACSLSFLIFCIVVVALSEFVRGTRIRQVILACANASLLATLVPDRRSWTFFATVLAVTYLSLVFVRLTRRGEGVAASIVLALLTFLYFKRFTFFASWIPVPFEWDLKQNPVELVGLSYILFKLIHLLVDEWQGQLDRCTPWSYLNYQLAFFTLAAGPIQRYNDFYRTWANLGAHKATSRDAMALWSRIMFGMLKIGILSAWAQAAFAHAANPHAQRDLANFAVLLYMYPLYLYLNFSGYTDVMVGAGGLLGFKVPENFNHPYLARNVLDFWDRWHISVTHWIRDYVFMTSYKVAATNFQRAARLWGYLLLFVALFLAGVWHGATAGYVAFGVLNGLGAVVARMYGDGLQRVLGRRRFHAYLKDQLIRWVAIFVTLNFVCLSLLFFSSGYDKAVFLLSNALAESTKIPAMFTAHSWRSRDFAIVIAIGVVAVTLWNFELIRPRIVKVADAVTGRPALFGSLLCMMTATVVVFFFLDWAFQDVPPPVRYMAF
jgi:alginate O-acetyltransferase complex protein AlgI